MFGGIMLGLTRASAAAALFAQVGCLSNYTPIDRRDDRPERVEVTHSVGGSHWRTMVDGGVWYQGYGPTLLALDPETGTKLDELRGLPLGSSGAVVDLVKYRGDLVAVLDRTAVARIDISNPKSLIVTELIAERELGLRPESLSVIGDALYVSGLGGVVRLDTGEAFLASSGVCGRVAPSAHGPVATRGREIVLLATGESLGRASDLQPVAEGAGSSGDLFFVLQGKDAARVGILDAELEEVVAVVVPGEVIRLRSFDGRLFAVTPTGITSWKLGSPQFADEKHIRVKGALDIDRIGSNTYAVTGSFGRALYRPVTDVRGPGDEFFAAQREPGRLERVLSDGRRIIAGSDEGNWMYMVGGSCDPTDKVIQNVNPPTTVQEFSFGRVAIEGADADPFTVESSSRVVVTMGGKQQTVQMPQGARARTIANVKDDIWIGHDDGIDVWRVTSGQLARVARVRMQGPVTNIYPRRTNDGASYVSLFGGMGVAMWRHFDAVSPATAAP